ncbi:MAG: glycosyltransferase family 2 protein [Aeromonas sp.]
MRDLISVLMPVYNVAPYIKLAIISLLSQSSIHFDIEIIVVDDGSSDETFLIAQGLAKQNACIKVFKNEHNLRICKTLNKALSYAQGNYIARLDGDDIALPGKLEQQFLFLQQKDLDLVGCQIISIDERGNEITRGKLPTGIEAILRSSQFESPIGHIWLAKRTVYDVLFGYREIPYAEDYDFLLRAFEQGFRCDNHSQALVSMRQRFGNTASVASLKQRKTHVYVQMLRQRRINGGNDNFSEDELETYIASSHIVNFLHIHSTKLLTSAFIERNKIMKLIKVAGCCLLSYYNFKYLLSRVMFRRSFVAK